MTVNSIGRSLYIVDWRMLVVEGGNVLHGVKREGELPVRGMSGVIFPGEYVQVKCPLTAPDTTLI